MNGKDPKLEKKSPIPTINPSPTITNNTKNDINNLFSPPIINNATNSENKNFFDNINDQNINPNNVNTEKKSFGFLKKKIQNEENLPNKINTIPNNTPDLFNLINDSNKQDNNQQQKTNPPAEKTGFSFIKSKNKESKVENNLNSNLLNQSDFTNSGVTDKPNKISNFDLLNEIYSQSIGDNNNSNINNNNQNQNNNINLLTDNLKNLNFNKPNDYITNDSFGGINFNLNSNINGNYNSNNYNNNNVNYNNFPNNQNSIYNNENNRRSSYVAPNFDVMFANSPDINKPLDGNSLDKDKNQNSTNLKTNEEIDFLSELNLGRKK